jgi:tryptophan halogenase
LCRKGDELFAVASWLQLIHGQGLRAGRIPLIDQFSKDDIALFLGPVRKSIRKCVDIMARHSEHVVVTCRARNGQKMDHFDF